MQPTAIVLNYSIQKRTERHTPDTHVQCIYPIVLSKRPRALTAQAPNLRVGSYTEEMLEWFDYSREVHTPNAKLVCIKLTCIIASPVFRRGQPDAGESCIMC